MRQRRYQAGANASGNFVYGRHDTGGWGAGGAQTGFVRQAGTGIKAVANT